MKYETPNVIKNLYSLEYHGEDDCIDFEAYPEFLDSEEMANIVDCWTGNHEYKGEEFRMFGQDGTGGIYAIWLIKENVDILDQPVVLWESEGQAYTVSTNFSDFLWCLENGFASCEGFTTESVSEFVKNNTTTLKRSVEIIHNEANELFDFRTFIWDKVKY